VKGGFDAIEIFVAPLQSIYVKELVHCVYVVEPRLNIKFLEHLHSIFNRIFQLPDDPMKICHRIF
jgi:hypothetical protein